MRQIISKVYTLTVMNIKSSLLPIYWINILILGQKLACHTAIFMFQDVAVVHVKMLIIDIKDWFVPECSQLINNCIFETRLNCFWLLEDNCAVSRFLLSTGFNDSLLG